MWRWIGLVLWVGCAGGEPGDTDWLDTDDSAGEPFDFEPLRELIRTELAALEAPGVAVAISLGGEVVFSEGFGFKNPELTEPMDNSTLMRVGSITKMLTAAGVLRQVDEGSIELGASLGTYVPEFAMNNSPEAATDVHVGHLLSHQAGFADYTPIDGGEEDALLESHANGVYSQYYFLMAPPGAMYNYSNPNFALAGLVLEKAAGRYYREEMAEAIFGPLGMSRTFFLADEVLADGNYATAETLDYWSGFLPTETVVGPGDYDDAFSRPAGFAWSSVGDLLKFAEFAMHGDDSLMSVETSSLMMSPQVNTLEFVDVVHYGFGWQLLDGYYWGEDSSWIPLEVVSHSGAIPGYAATLHTVPEHDLAIAVLSNGDGAYFSGSIFSAIEMLVELPEPGVDPLSVVDELPWEYYEGTYLDVFNVGTVEVVEEDGSLMAYMPDLDAINYPYEPELVPSSPGNFIQTLNSYPILVTFVPNEEGAITYFRTRHYVATRDASEAPTSQPPPDPRRLTRALRHPQLPALPQVRPARSRP
jgi:CubicO group peptidase (beta-lactamase class C family)